MNEADRAAMAREQQQRDAERLRSAREMYDWVSNFNWFQANQIEEANRRAERSKTEPALELWKGPPVEPVSGREVDSGEVGRGAERERSAREVFDWVSNFNRTQAGQVEEANLRAERAKSEQPSVERPPERVPEPVEPVSGREVDSGEVGRGAERERSAREVFDWVSNFNRTQAGQVEEANLRAERAKSEQPSVERPPERVPEPVEPVSGREVDSGEVGRGAERERSAREVFDWVSNFNRTQAGQVEEANLRAERAKSEQPSVERPPERVPEPVEPVSGREVDSGEVGRGAERERSAREVFDWVSNFNRTQAGQVEEANLRAERAKSEQPSVERPPERVPEPVEPVSGREVDSGEVGRGAERERSAREVFDWVSNFNRTQAGQVEEANLRAERAKSEQPSVERPPERVPEPVEPVSGREVDSGEVGRGAERERSAREVFDWVSNFNRTQAGQVEEANLRAERAKSEQPSVERPPERVPEPVEPVSGREVDSGEVGRGAERERSAREVFDWVSNFNRTQAGQVEEANLWAERAKSEQPTVEPSAPKVEPPKEWVAPAEETKSSAERIRGLESRIAALEGTEAPAAGLIDQLDSIDPRAQDAAQRIAALEERVAQWESEAPGPAEPSLGEVTAEAEAARRATLGEAAERLEVNKVRGTAGEVRVEGEILSGKPIPGLGAPATLRGSQVQVKTSAGLRIIDHLVELPTGKIVALEVKTGGAVRSQYQLDCDLALELQGGHRVGGGPIEPIPTVVLQR